MGFLDRFKSKKPEFKPTDTAVVSDVKSQDKPEVKTQAYAGKQVLVRPILTEKGTSLASAGSYVFIVRSDANKPEIKKAIQKIYSVHVTAVRIINSLGKKRRYGKSQGETSALKKAVVVLKEGEKIPGIIESVG